jgi:hypothetical protein
MSHDHGDRPDARDPTDELADQLDEVTGALEGLSQTLEAEEELPVVLQRCCWQAVHAIPGADLATVTLLHDASPDAGPDGGFGASLATAVSTEEHAVDLDRVQIDAGTGPCLDAARMALLVIPPQADGQAAAAAIALAASGHNTDQASQILIASGVGLPGAGDDRGQLATASWASGSS